MVLDSIQILPKLSAAHPELLLLENIFYHY